MSELLGRIFRLYGSSNRLNTNWQYNGAAHGLPSVIIYVTIVSKKRFPPPSTEVVELWMGGFRFISGSLICGWRSTSLSKMPYHCTPIYSVYWTYRVVCVVAGLLWSLIDCVNDRLPNMRPDVASLFNAIWSRKRLPCKYHWATTPVSLRFDQFASSRWDHSRNMIDTMIATANFIPF